MRLPSKELTNIHEAYKLVMEFNPEKEAKDILANPNKPSGTLPHSMEAVLDELAHWGQYGHQRVMDPEIAKLAVQLAALIKAKDQSNDQDEEEEPEMSSWDKWDYMSHPTEEDEQGE